MPTEAGSCTRDAIAPEFTYFHTDLPATSYTWSDLAEEGTEMLRSRPRFRLVMRPGIDVRDFSARLTGRVGVVGRQAPLYSMREILVSPVVPKYLPPYSTT